MPDWEFKQRIDRQSNSDRERIARYGKESGHDVQYHDAAPQFNVKSIREDKKKARRRENMGDGRNERYGTN
jgi:hypothetical protein